MTRAIMQTGALGRLVSLALLLLTATGCGELCEIKVATDAVPDGIVGAAYTATLQSECGTGDWSIAEGRLPPGIRLSDHGVLSGVPTVAGTYHFTVLVGDDWMEFDVRDFTVTIHDAP